MKTFQQFLESYLEPTLSECSIEDLEDFLMSEEFEQLDEISKKTLGSYIKKASIDASARMASTTGDAVRGVSFDRENSRKYGNRVRGVNKAVDRLTKEEFEQLDELSRGTLASYIDKASKSRSGLERKAVYGHDAGDRETARQKAVKRSRAIQHAMVAYGEKD